jgi:photosystem II stability/assembly factor-like uncharacterized protein
LNEYLWDDLGCNNMRFCSPKRLWLALMLLSVAAGGAQGQWRIVAPNVVNPCNSPLGGGQGSITFKDGVLWAGFTNLAFSLDSGKTWAVPNLSFNNGIRAISFWNKDSGLVTEGTTFFTSDRGNTWSYSNGGRFFEVFCTTQSKAYGTGTGFYQTVDNGQIWNNLNSNLDLDFGVRNNGGTIELLSTTLSLGSYVNLSNDSGITWNTNSGTFVLDSYSIGLDSCNPSLVYIASENYFDPTQDSLSRLFRSSDQGRTWQVTFSAPFGYLAGSFSCSGHAQFAGTNSNGVLRSTDQGITWKNIGGPNNVHDCRGICAVNDNIIFALDSGGNIWATFNSGGDSIIDSSTFSASPSELFATDTITCDSLTRTVSFQSAGCPLPYVYSAIVIGSDSASFVTSNLNDDSILVTLHGIKQGLKQAKLVILLNNGARDTVSLAGYVNLTPTGLTLSTSNVQTDTLGATVSVPITLNGLDRAENVDLILHYDGTVDYLGSFSPSGVQLDVPGQQWAGRSELAIIGATSGAALGYAKFNVFNDSSEAAHATFDSVTVLTQVSSCQYSMPAPATSTITTLSGCAVPILSQLIHFGVDPVFSVTPNPANGSVWISSSEHIGAATIEVYDMLGVKRSEHSTTVQKDTPIEQTLPDADGVYTILVKTTSGICSLRVVRRH